ncbi:hypothetical protein BC834DRAFT_897041 [Gloeopeniophorella convolvens]|nr:hypothetical protein BC834DRAFT_897041 [Gloeopeniophorella convolvens]
MSLMGALRILLSWPHPIALSTISLALQTLEDGTTSRSPCCSLHIFFQTRICPLLLSSPPSASAMPSSSTAWSWLR